MTVNSTGTLLNYPLHRGLQQYVKDLNRLYQTQPAMYEQDFGSEGFEWIDFQDANTTIVSFIRKAVQAGEELVFVFNFTPVPRVAYRIGVPKPGFYREMLNSDSEYYGGANLGLGGGLEAESIPHHGRPYSLSLLIPPLAMMVLKAEKD